jgi:apolipoprotein N-acyltransferase
VTLVMALIAGLAAGMAHALAQRTSRAVAAPLAGIAVLVLGDVGLSRIEWTAPSGAPVPVSLVQGNVLQDIKFDPQFRAATFDRYLRLVERSRGGCRAARARSRCSPTKCPTRCCCR